MWDPPLHSLHASSLSLSSSLHTVSLFGFIRSTIPQPLPILTAAGLLSYFLSRTRPHRKPNPRFPTGEAPSHHHRSLVWSCCEERSRCTTSTAAQVSPDSLCSASCPRPPRELRRLRAGQPAAICVCARRPHIERRRTSVGTDTRMETGAGRARWRLGSLGGALC
jgi:hypothetical protein